jgi:glucan-binding YG repeat protein
VLKTDGRYYIGSTYCDLPAGNYNTDENGKLLNGFVNKEDGIYYYVNGNSPVPGLICVDGEFYYVYWGGKLITNQSFFVSVTNGYTIPMTYNFDEYGRVIR